MDARCIQLVVYVAVYLEFDGPGIDARPVSSYECRPSSAVLNFLPQILIMSLYKILYVFFEP